MSGNERLIQSYDAMLDAGIQSIDLSNHPHLNNRELMMINGGADDDDDNLNNHQEQQQKQQSIVYPSMNSKDQMDITTESVHSGKNVKKEFVSKALLVSIGVGGMGGYMSGNIIRIGSRVVFGAIAALLLLGTTFTRLSRRTLIRKTVRLEDNRLFAGSVGSNSVIDNNDLERYEMLAKIGIDAANKQLQNINFREILVQRWDQIKEYTRDNYALTSSFLLGFIISMF